MNGSYNCTSPFLASNEASGVFWTLFLLFIIPLLIGLLIEYALLCNWLAKIFEKAGVSPWIAKIPLYNTWKFFEMGNTNPWLSLIIYFSFLMYFLPIPYIGLMFCLPIPYIGLIISGAGYLFYIIAARNISKGFNKESFFTLLYVFIPFVWFGILGFGKDKWSGKMYKKSSTPPAAPSTPTTPTTPTPTAPTPPSAA